MILCPCLPWFCASKPSMFAWPRSACARNGSGSCRGCLQARHRSSALWGVTNKLADLLSREAAPGGTGVRPLVLQQSSETVVLPRPRSWYRTLRPLSPVAQEGAERIQVRVTHGWEKIGKREHTNTRSRDCMSTSPKLRLLSFVLGLDLIDI